MIRSYADNMQMKCLNGHEINNIAIVTNHPMTVSERIESEAIVAIFLARQKLAKLNNTEIDTDKLAEDIKNRV